MTQFLFANNASTTLASAVAPTDTVIQVASGTGSLFPLPAAGQQFALTLQDAATGLIEEVCYCTAVSGDNLTVVRGREGSVARSWLVGDDASNYWTAGSAAAFVQLPTLQAQATNFAFDSGTANALAAALNPAIIVYNQIIGSPIRIFKNPSANTGNVTLTLNGLGPLPVVLPGGGQIPAGMLAGSSLIQVAYDGIRFELLSIGSFSSPGGPAGGDLAGNYPNPVVAANKIDNGKLAQAPGLTAKANPSGSLGNEQDVPFATLIAALGITWGTNFVQFGKTLFQWGIASVVSSHVTVSIPLPYANTSYSTLLTPIYGATFGLIANVTGSSITTNSFDIDGSAAGTGSPENFSCSWLTIGQAP